jgi:hypothetical protein
VATRGTLLGLLALSASACYASSHDHLSDALEEPGESETVDTIDGNPGDDNPQDDVPTEEATACSVVRTGDEIQLVPPPRYHHNGVTSHGMAFGNGTFGLAWSDDRDSYNRIAQIYFAVLDLEGEKLVEDTRLTPIDSTHRSYDPDVSFGGIDFAAVYLTQVYEPEAGPCEIFLRLVAPDGTQIGDETRVSRIEGTAHHPIIEPHAEGFAMLWCDSIEAVCSVKFTRLDREGNVTGDDVLISTVLDSRNFSMAYNGTNYGVVWKDEQVHTSSVYFSLIGSDGSIIVDAVRIGPSGFREAPSVAACDGEFGVTYTTEGTGWSQIFLARLSGSGERISGDIALSSGENDSIAPVVACSGGEYGVAWKDGSDYGVHFAMYSPAEGTARNEILVSEESTGGESISIATTGSEFGLAWNGGGQLFFSKVGCL